MFSGYAVVELMGHRVRAGLVTEVEMFGTKMLRLDIPGAESEFYSGAALYGLTRCTEEQARDHYSNRKHEPAPMALAGWSNVDADIDAEDGQEVGDSDDADFGAAVG